MITNKDIKEMHKVGLSYDEICSYKDCYMFNSDYGTTTIFRSIKDIREYYKGVIIWLVLR